MEPIIFKEDSANPLRIERTVWQERERIDVRKMFYGKKGDLYPTKNGLGLDIADGTAQAVLNAMLAVNGKALSVQDAYGVITIERREFKGHPLLDVRRFYKGEPSLHGFALTEDIEAGVIEAIAGLLELQGYVPNAIAEVGSVQAPTQAVAVEKPTPPPVANGDTKLAARLRGWAAALVAQIADKRRPLTQNPTRKRIAEYESRLRDALHLERAMWAMEGLAEAHENGDVPAALVGVRTKTQILDMVATRMKSSWDSCEDTGEFYDDSETGRALQAYVLARTDPERVKQAEIEKLETKALLWIGQIPGFFPTPADIITDMLGYADVREGQKVLEPSAGRGDIADRLREITDDVDVCEINWELAAILEKKGHRVAGRDFLEYNPGPIYDRIVMNPPFENGQDIDHVLHAYDLLAPEGRLVSVMSASVRFNAKKKYADFRNWLAERGGWMQAYPDGSFESSGTGVSTVRVIVEK